MNIPKIFHMKNKLKVVFLCVLFDFILIILFESVVISKVYAMEEMAEAQLTPRVRVEKVPDPTVEPWCLHGEIKADFGGDLTFSGTAFLIDNEYILTAAHNILLRKFFFNEEDPQKRFPKTSKWAQRIMFYPGKNDKEIALGEYEVIQAIVHFHWEDESKSNESVRPYDYGLLKLKTPVTLKMKIKKHIVLYPERRHKLNGKTARIVGYPSHENLQPGIMYHMKGEITDTKNRMRLSYLIDTYFGSSGSAVMIKRLENDVCVGIHNYGCEEGNVGTHVSAGVYEAILRWKKELSVPPKKIYASDRIHVFPSSTNENETIEQMTQRLNTAKKQVARLTKETDKLEEKIQKRIKQESLANLGIPKRTRRGND